MKSLKAIMILAILVAISTALAISGCTSPTTTPAPSAAPTTTPAPTAVAGPTALSISGKVNTSLDLTLSDLNGYTQHAAGWQNNAGNSTFNGTGPFVLDLLNKAGLKSDAANVTFTCTDPANSMSTTVTLANMNSKYSDSIVAYNWTGINKQGVAVTNTNNTLQLIMPAGGGKNQVGNITQITVS
jgi:hypothetical protein